MASERGEPGQPWTLFEIEATVAAYAEMLDREVRGESYSKAEVVRGLGVLLPARTPGSIERKFQNISAIRDELGLPWIEGYKPLPHYQWDLRVAVIASVAGSVRLGEALGTYESSALPTSQPRPLATSDVLVAPPGGRGHKPRRSTVTLTGGPLPALRDFQRRELGTAGEEWVVRLEREQLRRSGHDDLAALVRWVARDDGDGAGFDIRSFRETGQERLIEVKTTNLGPLTPFYITRWEIDVSRQRAESYSLYRVHGFNRDPRIYVLDGNVEELATLEPKVFLGIPA